LQLRQYRYSSYSSFLIVLFFPQLLVEEIKYCVTKVSLIFSRGSLRDKKRLQKRFLSLKKPPALPTAKRSVFFEARKSCDFLAS